MTQSVEDIIQAAHAVVYDLLRTKVTAHDVEAALERRCNGWTEQDRAAALRLAVEFAQIKGDAVWKLWTLYTRTWGRWSTTVP